MKIQLYDSKGIAVNLGDWVKVTDDHYRKSPFPFCFFAQVKILEDGTLQPFQNFCFDQIEKVEGPPENVPVNQYGFYLKRGPTEKIDETNDREYAIQLRMFEAVKKRFIKFLP